MYCTEHCTYDLIPGTLLGADGTAEARPNCCGMAASMMDYT